VLATAASGGDTGGGIDVDWRSPAAPELPERALDQSRSERRV
jgi:hypothetical protein